MSILRTATLTTAEIGKHLRKRKIPSTKAVGRALSPTRHGRWPTPYQVVWGVYDELYIKRCATCAKKDQFIETIQEARKGVVSAIATLGQAQALGGAGIHYFATFQGDVIHVDKS